MNSQQLASPNAYYCLARMQRYFDETFQNVQRRKITCRRQFLWVYMLITTHWSIGH